MKYALCNLIFPRVTSFHRIFSLQLEWVIEDFMKYRDFPDSPDNMWSHSKLVGPVLFRLLAFPKGYQNPEREPGDVRIYIWAEPLAPSTPCTWTKDSVLQITALNWRNWEESSIVTRERGSLSTITLQGLWILRLLIPKECLVCFENPSYDSFYS